RRRAARGRGELCRRRRRDPARVPIALGPLRGGPPAADRVAAGSPAVVGRRDPARDVTAAAADRSARRLPGGLRRVAARPVRRLSETGVTTQVEGPAEGWSLGRAIVAALPGVIIGSILLLRGL